MSRTEKILEFDSFEELCKAMVSYRKLGVVCEMRSWEQVGKNVMHIFEDEEWWKVWERDEEWQLGRQMS